jgi:cytochrome c
MASLPIQRWFTGQCQNDAMIDPGSLASSKIRLGLMAAALLPLLTAAAQASDAVAKDRAALFTEHCATCHADPHSKSPQAKIGPSLTGIVGQKAGAQPGYTRYSAALKASGKLWTAANLAAYIAAPMDFVPGTTMALIGVTTAEDRAALIAYLNSAPAR